MNARQEWPDEEPIVETPVKPKQIVQGGSTDVIGADEVEQLFEETPVAAPKRTVQPETDEGTVFTKQRTWG